MAQRLEPESIQQAVNLCPFLLRLPQKELYSRYDEEADVLYLQFQNPANPEIHRKAKEMQVAAFNAASMLSQSWLTIDIS